MKTRKQRQRQNKFINLRYLPNKLTNKDRKKQSQMLLKSRRLYKQKKYYTRKPKISDWTFCKASANYERDTSCLYSRYFLFSRKIKTRSQPFNRSTT